MLSLPGIAFLVFIILELVVLFLFAKSLTGALGKLILRVTKNRAISINIMALLFLPGTIIHELAHLLTAGIMLVPVGEIDILPKFEGEQVLLGSVEVAETDFFRRAVIGMAPLLWGVAIIIILSWTAFGTVFGNLPSWIMAIFFYLVFSIGNTMFSSEKDMEGMVAFMVVLIFLLLVMFGAFYLTGYWPTFVLDFLQRSESLNFLQKTMLFLSIPIFLDLVLLMIAKLFLELKPAK